MSSNKLLTTLTIILIFAGITSGQILSGRTPTPPPLPGNDRGFRSGGGFKLDLPKKYDSSREIDFDDGALSGYGKEYIWSNRQDYTFQVAYYKLDKNGQNVTVADKKRLMTHNLERSGKNFAEKKIPFTSKPILRKDVEGFEIEAVSTENGIKIIERQFVRGQRYYVIILLFDYSVIDETTIRAINDSFKVLDTETLKAVKIEEAMPQELPQEPVAAKLKTDLQDLNLKGKVKSVIEDIQYEPKKPFNRDSEKYFNQSGQVVKEVDFDDGWPISISLWGYVDAKRVRRIGYISFDSDQFVDRIEKIVTMDATLPTAPQDPDPRFDERLAYIYDDAGRLVEEAIISNTNVIGGRTVYKFSGVKREKFEYGFDGELWTKTVETIDRNGNIIEEHIEDERFSTLHVYQNDTQGNWILRKSFEKKTIRGKAVTVPLSTTRRTIEYYP